MWLRTRSQGLSLTCSGVSARPGGSIPFSHLSPWGLLVVPSWGCSQLSPVDLPLPWPEIQKPHWVVSPVGLPVVSVEQQGRGPWSFSLLGAPALAQPLSWCSKLGGHGPQPEEGVLASRCGAGTVCCGRFQLGDGILQGSGGISRNQICLRNSVLLPVEVSR